MSFRFEGEEDAQVVEGQVVGRSEPPPSQQPFWQVGAPHTGGPGMWQTEAQAQATYGVASGAGVDLTGLVDAGVSLASSSKSRSIALLVKVPLFAYVALNHRIPPLVRLASAVLGAMEALEALQRQSEYEQMLPPQGY